MSQVPVPVVTPQVARAIAGAIRMEVDGEAIGRALYAGIAEALRPQFDQLRAEIQQGRSETSAEIAEVAHSCAEFRTGIERILIDLRHVSQRVDVLVEDRTLSRSVRQRLDEADRQRDRDTRRLERQAAQERQQRDQARRRRPPALGPELRRGRQGSYALAVPGGLAAALGINVGAVRHYGGYPNCGPAAADHALGVQGSRRLVREWLQTEGGRAFAQLVGDDAAQRLREAASEQRPAPVEEPFFRALTDATQRHVVVAFESEGHFNALHFGEQHGGEPAYLYHAGTYFHVEPAVADEDGDDDALKASLLGLPREVLAGYRSATDAELNLFFKETGFRDVLWPRLRPLFRAEMGAPAAAPSVEERAAEAVRRGLALAEGLPEAQATAVAHYLHRMPPTKRTVYELSLCPTAASLLQHVLANQLYREPRGLTPFGIRQSDTTLGGAVAAKFAGNEMPFDLRALLRADVPAPSDQEASAWQAIQECPVRTREGSLQTSLLSALGLMTDGVRSVPSAAPKNFFEVSTDELDIVLTSGPAFTPLYLTCIVELKKKSKPINDKLIGQLYGYAIRQINQNPASGSFVLAMGTNFLSTVWMVVQKAECDRDGACLCSYTEIKTSEISLRQMLVSLIVYECRFRGRTAVLKCISAPFAAYAKDAWALRLLAGVEGVPELLGVCSDGVSVITRPLCKPVGAGAVAHFDTLVRTVQAAHERNVVHRDIRPTNVLAFSGGDKQMQLFLIDWGFAATPGPNTYVGVYEYTSSSVQRSALSEAVQYGFADDLVALVKTAFALAFPLIRAAMEQPRTTAAESAERWQAMANGNFVELLSAAEACNYDMLADQLPHIGSQP
eukprot:m51a1_g10165 hypothetical protein (846) ;mRNA; f:69473-76694